MELSLKERIKIILALKNEARSLGGQVHTFEQTEGREEYYEESKSALLETVDLIKKIEEATY